MLSSDSCVREFLHNMELVKAKIMARQTLTTEAARADEAKRIWVGLRTCWRSRCILYGEGRASGPGRRGMCRWGRKLSSVGRSS